MKRKIGNSWGVGGYTWPLWNGNFEGVGGSNRKNHPWEGYGYFLESHIRCGVLGVFVLRHSHYNNIMGHNAIREKLIFIVF